MSQMCCNQDCNIIAYVNTRKKFKFSVFIVKRKCIIATQLRSPLKLLGSPFRNCIAWKIWLHENA